MKNRNFAPGEYAEVLREMAQRRRFFGEWFRPFDAILLPTVATPALSIDEMLTGMPVPPTPGSDPSSSTISQT